jgi:hypothetical protein
MYLNWTAARALEKKEAAGEGGLDREQNSPRDWQGLPIRSNQQGAHQQRPAGPHTQCRPARQLAPGPPQAVLMTGEKFFAVMARFPDPPVIAASAFQVSAPANRIAAEAASMSMSLRIDSSRFFFDQTWKVFTCPAKKATRSSAERGASRGLSTGLSNRLIALAYSTGRKDPGSPRGHALSTIGYRV